MQISRYVVFVDTFATSFALQVGGNRALEDVSNDEVAFLRVREDLRGD